MKFTTHLHVVRMLRMHGDIPSLSHTSSWRGAYLSTGQLYLTLPRFPVLLSVVIDHVFFEYLVSCRACLQVVGVAFMKTCFSCCNLFVLYWPLKNYSSNKHLTSISRHVQELCSYVS